MNLPLAILSRLVPTLKLCENIETQCNGGISVQNLEI